MPSKASFLKNSTNSELKLKSRTRSLKLTEWKCKSWWLRTTALGTKSETPKKTSDFQLPKSESWITNSRSPVMKSKPFKGDFKNAAMLTKRFQRNRTKSVFFHNKLKDWTVSSKRRTSNSETLQRSLQKSKPWPRLSVHCKKESPDWSMRTLRWKDKCKMLNRIWDSAPTKIKRSWLNFKSTREELSKMTVNLNNTRWRSKNFWVKIIP